MCKAYEILLLLQYAEALHMKSYADIDDQSILIVINAQTNTAN